MLRFVVDADVAMREADVERYQAALISTDLPEISGYQLIRIFRREERTRRLPIIAVCADKRREAALAALESGADDVVQAPPDARELRLRLVRLMDREHAGPRDGELRCGGIIMAADRRAVWAGGKRVGLTTGEFGLLRALLTRPGRVHDRAALTEKAWDCRYIPTSRTLDTHIANLRRKIHPYGERIRTVHGVGYVFDGGRRLGPDLW